jgi:hypothetical protein
MVNKTTISDNVLGCYCKRKKTARDASPSSQLMAYLSICDDYEYEASRENACLNFWSLNRKKLGLIFPLAMRILSVPATSAPVERVFSHGGFLIATT